MCAYRLEILKIHTHTHTQYLPPPPQYLPLMHIDFPELSRLGLSLPDSFYWLYKGKYEYHETGSDECCEKSKEGEITPQPQMTEIVKKIFFES